MEELRRKQEELVQATIRENEEKEQRVARKNKERIEELRRENNQIEEEQRRRNEESLALLLLENEAQLVRLMAKQKEEEERVARKRKADQPATNTKQPAAPECPVRLLKTNFWLFSSFCHRFASTRWSLPLRFSTVSMGITSAGLASKTQMESTVKNMKLISNQVRLEPASLPKVQKNNHWKSF